MIRWAVMAVVVMACNSNGARPIDAGVDPDGGVFVPGGDYVPATIRFRDDGLGAGFGPCELAGQTVDYGKRVIVDDCVECQCTTYGFRCHKRASCGDDRCVFIDGQVVPKGGTAIVETCFDCICGDDGPACRRRTEAPCPANGCKLADMELAFEQERFVSECHACTCDETAGLSCTNVCHPECPCPEGQLCSHVCAEQTCPLAIADQERVELACGSVVCDYGSLIGDGCE